MNQAFFNSLHQEHERIAKLLEQMKPAAHLEKTLETIRSVSRLEKTIAKISLPKQYLAELNRHLELKQDLVKALDRAKSDISTFSEISRQMDAATQQIKTDLTL